jgi:exopolysaccharide biosynthesis polyprenyl glycosylphosphotransferase
LLLVLTACFTGRYRIDVALDPRRLRAHALTAAAIAALPIVGIAEYFGAGLTPAAFGVLALMPAAWLLCVRLTRSGLSLAGWQDPLMRRVLVIGSGRAAARFGELLRSRHGPMFEPVTFSGDLASVSAIALRAEGIWGVVVADEPGARSPASFLIDWKLRGTRIFDVPGFTEQHLGRIDPDATADANLLYADGFGGGRLDAAIKRGCDIFFSLMLLFLTFPVMLVTAALIKLDSPGPVFYRQRRVGLHNAVFTVLKFRSMRTDAEQGDQARWAQRYDPRITRVGRFIRSVRIDELPQLINVLRGDMSLVGPRPERPAFVEQLAKIIPHYQQRSYVKPGLTGWAQVNYPYGASIEDAREKLAYDLYYVKNRHLLLDIMILLATVRVVLFREGAR